jgi:hypothetical protein
MQDEIDKSMAPLKWENYCTRATYSTLTKNLKEMTDGGWEVVSVVVVKEINMDFIIFAKRPIFDKD